MPVLFQKLNSLVVLFYLIVSILCPTEPKCPGKIASGKLFSPQFYTHKDFCVHSLLSQRGRSDIKWTQLRRQVLYSGGDCTLHHLIRVAFKNKMNRERKTKIHEFTERGYRIRPKFSPLQGMKPQPMQLKGSLRRVTSLVTNHWIHPKWLISDTRVC